VAFVFKIRKKNREFYEFFKIRADSFNSITSKRLRLHYSAVDYTEATVE